MAYLMKVFKERNVCRFFQASKFLNSLKIIQFNLNAFKGIEYNFQLNFLHTGLECKRPSFKNHCHVMSQAFIQCT